MSNKPRLKYLFLAEFTDGTSIKQTSEDKSSLDPEKRSQYYDVIESGKKIKTFSLIQKNILGLGNVITVDLITGLFTINGLRVILEGDKLPTMPDEFKLIFYRQRTENIKVTYNLKDGGVTDQEPIESFCEYFIGWQCTIAGKNYQQKIAVA